MAIRIGILGCGKMSKNHAKAIIEHPETELVGLCDLNEEIIQNWFNEHLKGIINTSTAPQIFNDSSKMYSQAQLDAVVISTPHTAHFKHGKEALLAGCHVFMEKPMVTSTADARELKRLTEEIGKIVVIGYNTPSTPSFQYLRELVRKGNEGTGFLGRLEMVNGFLAQDWKRNTTGLWRQDPVFSGGGQAYDSGAHLLNSLVWTIESSPQKVFSLIDQMDTPVDINTVLVVSFKNNVMASITISGNCPAEGASMTFVFDSGRIDIDGWNGKWIHVYDSSANEVKIELPEKKMTPLENFIDSILGKDEPATSPLNGVMQSQLMDAIYDSGKSGLISLSN